MERLLSHGEPLLDDIHEGFMIASEYHGAADLQNLKPKGRRLGDRGIMARQQAGLPWFVFHFQEKYGPDDALVSRRLRLVEWYSGLERQGQIELA